MDVVQEADEESRSGICAAIEFVSGLYLITISKRRPVCLCRLMLWRQRAV